MLHLDGTGFVLFHEYREINMIHIKCIHSRLTFIRGYIHHYIQTTQTGKMYVFKCTHVLAFLYGG